MEWHRMSKLLRASVAVCLLTRVAHPLAAQGDALELQKRAIERIDRVIDEVRRGADLQSKMGELSQADMELTASNGALAARSDWTPLARGLNKQGTIYRLAGQLPNAITLYQQAEQAAVRGKDLAQQADALAWRAFTEQMRVNLGQAIADATRAVQLAEKTADPDVLARALDVLGGIQIAQLDLVAAAATLNREVAAAAKATDPVALYYAYLNRADVYLKTAERCDYQRSFQPCYDALDRAGADFREAAAIVRRLGFTALLRQTDGFVREVETRRALIRTQEAAHGAVQKANIFHPVTLKDVLVTERYVSEPGAVPPALAALYQESQRLQRSAGALGAASEARTYFVDGLMNEMRGSNDAAQASFLKAVDLLESDRRSLRDERSRGTFLEDRIGFYYAAVQQALERRRYDQAFELLERSRSRALADLLASRTPGLGRPDEQKLFGELMTLRTQIADAQGKLFEQLASSDQGDKATARTGALQTQIRSLETRYQDVAARIATTSPRLQNLVASSPATLKALQQVLREERSEVLQYLVLEHAVLLWHITADSIAVRNVFLPRTEVIGKTASLRKSLADRNAPFDERTAREMFLYLVAPVLSRIKSDRLIVIPHEDLHYVPFQVFQDPADGRYLGERFQITYAPSASVFLGLRRSAGLAGGRLLAIADPGIAAAGGEVAAIAKLFPGQSRVIADELAREADVKASVRDFDVIHLSVHGKFDSAEPMLSYLLLDRGPGEDGRLTAAEMFGLPLEKSRLVVLSACETGRAEATHGNEVLGMLRALIYAGAGTIVLSHWEVDSEATAQWMLTFYEAARSRPVPDAARAALVKVKSLPQYRHPYYWSAFTTIGR